MHEDSEPIKIARNRMVLVVARGHLLQPFTDRRDRLVHSATQFCFDCMQLCHHPLLRCFPPYDKGSIAPALPTVMGEAQKREGLRLALSTLLPVPSGEPPELNQPCLLCL